MWHDADGCDHLPQPPLRHVARCAGLIRNAGVEPQIIEYLKTFPTRAMLLQLAARIGVRCVIAADKEPIFRELGLKDKNLSDDALLDALEAHPILLNRPIVVTPKGSDFAVLRTRDRPFAAPAGEFFKENGERIVDERGRRVASA